MVADAGTRLVLLGLLLHAAPAVDPPEVVPEADDADDFRLECLRGTGIDVWSESSLPHPTTSIGTGLWFAPGEHTKWNQVWLEAYWTREPEFAGPTVYFPNRPPATTFDFDRSQPPNNRTLADYGLDGTGIPFDAVQITKVTQEAFGQVRLSGTLAEFQEGGAPVGTAPVSGYTALHDFWSTLGGLCESYEGCRGEIVRVLATHNDDRIPTGATDVNGDNIYFDTVVRVEFLQLRATRAFSRCCRRSSRARLRPDHARLVFRTSSIECTRRRTYRLSGGRPTSSRGARRS